MRWTEFRDWWIRQSREAVFSQWARVGLPFGSGFRCDWLLDPEALLAATCVIGRTEARMFDTVMDWCRQNARIFDRTRLKSLLKGLSLETRVVVLAVWDHMSEEVGPPPDDIVLEEPMALFWKPEGSSLTTHLDEGFATRGLRRGLYEPAEGRAPVRYDEVPAGRIRIRGLVGTNARAEVIALLATVGQMTTAWIGRESLYTRRSVQLTVRDFEAAGFASLLPDGQVAASSQLLDVADALALEKGSFRSGVLMARALDATWTVTRDIEERELTAYAAESRVRDLVEALDDLLANHLPSVRTTYKSDTMDGLLDKAQSQLRPVLRLVDPPRLDR